MKKIKLFEEFINERSTVFAGNDGTSPIISAIIEEFGKLPAIQNLNTDNIRKTLKIINDEWAKFEKTAKKIAVKETIKTIGRLSKINFITYQHSEWEQHAKNDYKVQHWFKLSANQHVGESSWGVMLDVNLDTDPGLDALRKKDFKFKDPWLPTWYTKDTPPFFPPEDLIYGKFDESKGKTYRLYDTSLLIVGRDDREIII